ncbi:unnamed protein product [Kluyveromyces dobzhanskii CBS 2104]|uniref:U1 small nuclear ribonucleoprotein component SNU71 n=1 Tax=Kluyveromyces dobzhanskii CBS 2104 TaxID=1427455 RepID=A0A0A8L530_9SACH|nr:unnamed protein product [Kluyveromyces dobzhanskii CBS 2104]
MDTVLFVSPTLYSCKDSQNWESAVPKPGYVPILKSDLPKFQQTLQKANSTRQQDGDDASISEVAVTKSTDGSVATSSRFVELKAFLPISLEQQLHTVCLRQFPLGVGVKGIEKVMDKLDHLICNELKTSELPAQLIKRWSYLDCVNSWTVYMSFQDSIVGNYAEVIRLIEALFKEHPDGITLHTDENTKRYVADLEKGSSGIELEESVVEEFRTLLTVLRSEPGAGSSGQDRGAGNSSAVEYNVDLSALSDLPSSALDQLCKDIVEFRTRVITLEKEKRNKELAEEEKRRKQSLKQMFERIKISNGEGSGGGSELEDGPPESAVQEENDDDDDDDEDEDDDDDGTENYEAGDYEAEQKRVQADKDSQQQLYESMVKEFQDNLLVKFTALRQEHQYLQNYEAHLQKNKGSALKELLHAAADPHYDHRRQYKDSEARADEEDLARESEQASVRGTAEEQAQELEPGTSENAADSKIKLALKKAVEKEPQEPEEPQEVASPSTFQDKLKLLRESGVVEELVKEYLGVYEPDLVEYIFENMAEHESTEALEKELAETFDEDGPVLVGRIWDALQPEDS